MPMDMDVVFTRTALDALRDNMLHLNKKQQKKLCNELIKLCEVYAPGTFKTKKS